MANHGFVTTKKWMNAEQIERDILEIIERRFKGKLHILNKNGSTEHYVSWWEIEPPNVKDPWAYGFTVQLTTRRKLEFRHPPGDWPMWAQVVVQQELAAKYNGIISDEGIPDRWKPDLKKYRTYADWVEKMHAPRSKNKWHIMAMKSIARILRGTVPRPLKGL